MSQNSNLNSEEFTRVPYRKKERKLKYNQIENKSDDIEQDSEIDIPATLRRTESAKEEILSSDILSSTFASLREGLSLLNNPVVKDIYCLGLGHIGERLIPRYQLALLLCIKDKYNTNVYIHDPIFYQQEKELLKQLDIIVLDENKEGKYKSKTDIATIFFLPHCPKQLTNNLLWSNWSLNLKNCIIIANSFNNIIDETPKHSLNENCTYLLKILPYTVELPIINTFKYFDVFNDTAIHIFPLSKLNLIPEDFWNNCPEPHYSSEDWLNNLIKMALKANVQLLRNLLSEIRHAVPAGSLKDNLTARYILNQFHKYKVTDQQLCKAQEEMQFLGNTYMCYLKSSRKYNEINQAFHGKGERTVAETANMVGFKLPHDPK